MASTFRIYGPEVGEPTAIVDADVSGVSMSGEIELTLKDEDDGDSFSITPERLRELENEGLVYDGDDVDEKAEIWKAIEDVEKHFEAAENSKQAFKEAAKALFRGAD